MKRVLYLILPLLFLVSCLSGGLYYGKERGGIVRTAQKYLGVPYKHGGASPQGFDCSGYVMFVYEKNGILLPRSVHRQYQAGHHIRKSQVKPGDLVFFKTSGRQRLSHVGIYMGGRRFIHAPSTGKKVSFADMGKPYWKKRYIGAVKFI